MSPPTARQHVTRLTAPILLFAGGVLCGIFARGLLDPSDPPATTTGRDSISPDDWSRLLAAIERLERAGASPPIAAPDERVLVGGPTDHPGSITELANNVKELQAAIERLRVVSAQTAGALPDTLSAHELTFASRDVDWNAIDALAALSRSDPEGDQQAFAEVRLATPVEILRRFGPPVTVRASQGGITFEYFREVLVDGEFDSRGVSFFFAGGILVGLTAE